MAEQLTKPFTPAQKIRILIATKEFFKGKSGKKDAVNIAEYNKKVLDEQLDIKHTEYIAGKKSRVKKLIDALNEMFDGFLVTNTVLLGETPHWFCWAKPNFNYDKAISNEYTNLTAQFAKESKGKYPFFQPPGNFREPYRLNCSDYSAGEEFLEWVKKNFYEDFYVNNNYLIPKIKPQSKVEGEKKTDNDAPSAAETPESPAIPVVTNEIIQMHSVCFMYWWQTNKKALQAYTGQSRKPEEWSSIVANALARALLGVAPLYIYGEGKEVKLVFNAGIKSANGNSIYCLIKANEKNLNGKLQPFMLESFCCINEEDNEFTEEIKKNIPGILNDKDTFKNKQNDLAAHIDSLKRLQKKIETLLPGLSENVSDGMAIDSDVVPAINSYRDKWNKALEIIDFLGWTDDREALSIDSIAERLEGSNMKEESFNQAKAMFAELAQQLKEYVEECGWEKIGKTIEEDIKLSKAVSLENYAPLKDILEYYVQFIRLTEFTAFNGECASVMEFCHKHFDADELQPRTMSYVLLGKKAGELKIGRKTIAREILDKLSAIDNIADDEDIEEEKKVTVSVQQLLEKATSQQNLGETAEVLSLISSLAETKLEQALVTADFAKAKELVLAGASSGKSEEEMLAAIDTLNESGSTELNMSACAERLTAVVGAENDTAEKFLIAGLVADTDKCLKALIDLYVAENELEKFYKVYSAYGSEISLTETGKKFLINALCMKGKDTLTEHLDKNIYILYMPQYRQTLIEAVNNASMPEILDRYEKLIAREEFSAERNEIEELVAGCQDKADLQRVAARIDEIIESGEDCAYTKPELQSISEQLRLEAEEYMPAFAADLLYKLQKNKNGVAEQLFWEQLSYKYSDSAAVTLMKILFEQERYAEICALFGCYDELMAQGAARELYLCALMKTTDPLFCDFAKENMQDCMSLIAKEVLSVEAVNEAIYDYSKTENKAAVKLCQDVLTMSEHLKDSVVSSIITLSDDLREIAINKNETIKLGLDDTQVESFASVFRTDTFSRKRDILGIAERLYAFIGCANGAAECFAFVAQNYGYDAVALLWKISSDNNNYKEKLRLLNEYPELREGRQQELCDALFHEKEYESFLGEVESLGNFTQDTDVQLVIAKCTLKKVPEEELERLTESFSDISAEKLAVMLGGMADAGFYDQVNSFIVSGFEKMLSQYSAEQIAQIISADGKLSDAKLKKLQSFAGESEVRKLEVYLHEIFGVGHYKKKSKEFLEESLAHCEDCDSDSCGETYRELMIIYAENKEYKLKVILSEIRTALSHSDDAAVAVTKLETALDGVTLDKEGILEVMELLKNYELPLTSRVYINLINMSISEDMIKECIEFLSSFEGFFKNLKNTEVLYMLCSMYKQAISQGFFETEWSKNAISVCAGLINTQYFCDAAYCFCKIHKNNGEIYLAKSDMLALIEKKHEIPEDIRREIDAEAEELQITENTDIFSLFAEMAEASELREIEAYCRYCAQYVNINDSMVNYYNESIRADDEDEEAVLSAEQSNILLRLLYNSPSNKEYWMHCARMPLDSYAAARAKLLYKLSLLSNEKRMWFKCIDACEFNSLKELMSDVIIACANRIQVPYHLKELREFIIKKLKLNSHYLSQFGEADCTALISAMCERMKNSFGNQEKHSAVRDMTIIAIATNYEQSYKTAIASLEEYIFGENSNVGFSVACQLLLKKKYADTQEILRRLSVIADVKYKKLIGKLSGMSGEELESWSLDKNNRQLLDMIIPDGNYPAMDEINEFIISNICDPEKAEAASLLICELLENRPNDYGYYMALFIFCKQLPHRTDLLHKAVAGLIRNDPPAKSGSYYTLTRKDFAVRLANLNAMIISRELNQQSDFDGYDFRITAEEYYQQYESDYIDSRSIKDIQEAFAAVDVALANRSAQSSEIKYSLIFGYVTGSWSDFILRCWKTGEDMAAHLSLYSDIGNGFARSLLKAVYSIEKEGRDDFIEWVKKINDEAAPENSLGIQLDIFFRVYNEGYYDRMPLDVFEQDILELPFEESSTFDFVYRNTVLQTTSKSPADVPACVYMVASLAYTSNVMGELWKTAMKAFESSNYELSVKIIAEMIKIRDDNIIRNVAFGAKINKFKAIYEVTKSVVEVFAGNEKTIERISDPNFPIPECLNMILALLYTKKSNEANRLRQYFAEDNAKLIDVILKVINPGYSDEEKLATIAAVENSGVRAYAYFVAKSWNKSTKSSAFFSDSSSYVAVLNKFRASVAPLANSALFTDTYNPIIPIWLEPYRFDKGAYRQNEYQIETDNKEVSVELEPEKINQLVGAFSFVSELEAVEGDGRSIEDLWNEHESIYAYEEEAYISRLDLSRYIYQLALAEGANKNQLNDYAIRYGLDRYYYSMALKNYSQANDFILEMVSAADISADTEGVRMLKNTVRSTALHELLHRGYSSIDTLVSAYIENKQAFIRMRNMLPVSTMSVELDDVNRIYSALEMVAKCFRDIAESYTEARKSELNNAMQLIRSTSLQGWSTVRMSVVQLIRDEINRLNQKPRLTVEVLSKKSDTPSGAIFGQVENIGVVAAENIVIQIMYSNGTASNPYFLIRLDRGEVAAFEINYSSDITSGTLEYDIAVMYSDKDESYNMIQKEQLRIEEKPFREYKTGVYGTDGAISDFVLAEDGRVVSENFFGREEEKKKIAAMFDGGRFVNYKNVVIKGIRRAGKTSLLNFLVKYVEYKCDDAVAVLSNCEGVKADQAPLQRVFINPVIARCREINAGNKSPEDWDMFSDKWKLREGAQDCDTNELKYFYRELKEMNGGKGLMLVIDEFDILLEECENKKGIDSMVLTPMRSLVNNMYSKECIHLAICGSNKLIRYIDGGTLNQFFQQFGENFIEIGMLLGEEMKTMLEAPYRDDPNLKIPDETFEWVWKYTRGLVWYSKLVMSAAINRAYFYKRNTVYPSDVIDAITTVAGSDNYFKSLRTSCRPSELRVLDAMQSLCSSAGDYVTVSELLELLAGEISENNLEGILQTLKSMSFIQQNPYDRYSYRYAVELYWHYFRHCPTDFVRNEEIPVYFKEERSIRRRKNYD